MNKLVGFERKSGEFTSRETGEVILYDNFMLYAITDCVSAEVTGFTVCDFKVKTEMLTGIFNCMSNDVSDILIKLLNTEFEPSFVFISGKPVLNGLIFKNNK